MHPSMDFFTKKRKKSKKKKFHNSPISGDVWIFFNFKALKRSQNFLQHLWKCRHQTQRVQIVLRLPGNRQKTSILRYVVKIVKITPKMVIKPYEKGGFDIVSMAENRSGRSWDIMLQVYELIFPFFLEKIEIFEKS